MSGAVSRAGNAAGGSAVATMASFHESLSGA